MVKKDLSKALGRVTKILGTSNEEVYRKKLEAMDRTQLFSHGINEHGITPSMSTTTKEEFADRCVKLFRKKINYKGNRIEEPKQKRRTKQFKQSLSQILEKIK